MDSTSARPSRGTPAPGELDRLLDELDALDPEAAADVRLLAAQALQRARAGRAGVTDFRTPGDAA